MDWNAVAEEFADLIADKVMRRLRLEQLRDRAPDWPAVEPKESPIKDEPLDDEPVTKETVSDDEEDSDVVSLKAAMGTPKLANSKADARRSELSRVNIRTLRNKFSSVENKDASDYSHLSKDELVNSIVDFESLIGRTIDEEIDRLLVESGLKVGVSEAVEEDNDFSEPEPEDDTEAGELTREEAERLSLRELKTLALANEVSEDDLAGKDIKAVVDLLFGSLESEAAPEASEDDEEEGYTAEEIEAMSIAELKSLIDDINEQGADPKIEYTRATTRGELVDLVFGALEEVED